MIWKEVLGQKTYVAITNRRWQVKTRKPNPSLLLSCRKIYWETALLPFKVDAFRMEIPFYRFPLQLCLTRIKECFRIHAKKVEFEVRSFDPTLLYIVGEPFPNVSSLSVSFRSYEVMYDITRPHPRHLHESHTILWLVEHLFPQIKSQMPNVVQVTTKPSTARIRKIIKEHGF